MHVVRRSQTRATNHAVIKYLAVVLHETPNRSPVTASHNHNDDDPTEHCISRGIYSQYATC